MMLLNNQKIVKKPWGSEIIWGDISGICLGKILNINQSQRLSRQYHKQKEEVIYVISGNLTLEIGLEDDGSPVRTIYMSEGNSYHILPNTIHRFCAPDSENVVLAEISTYFPKDVVRLEDDYSRE